MNMSPHDIKERLLEIVGAFLPGMPKSRRQEELERIVDKQQQRIEQRRIARVRARGVPYDAEEGRAPSAEHYADWMNLNYTRPEPGESGRGEEDSGDGRD